MDKVPITKAGFENLKKELERLNRIDVPQNIKDIEEARAHGDISENAEYAAAKERQSFIQGKIQEIENNLATSVVIDLNNLTDERVVFGTTVTIEDIDSGETTQYQLVGPFESDISKNKISVTSPIGKALIGKEIGEEVTFRTPGGTRNIEVLDITIETEN
ncbi:MAG: transcription elongation factor GreA [Deltaproteobacteria bacterium]|nr:transcription elongation factor GreA [Deltaproteobacteria bacterium]MBN2844903.1 transcription elongation factor GreA [Deltaproteobacteria bacterium]